MADAVQILNNLLDRIAIEQKYENSEIIITKIPNEGANFSSFLFEATISAKGKHDLNLFAKVAAAGEALRAQAPMKVFEVESYFYEKLLAKYKKLEDDHNIEDNDRLITPTFYGAHPTLYEETIVLEDLKSKGFTTLGRLELLDWEYASAAINELAKLHALSFAYAQEHPEEFAKDLVILKFELPMNSEIMQQMIGVMTQKTLALASDENKPKFAQYLGQLSVPEMVKYFLPNENVVLKHGDYRASNLMHKRDEHGKLTVIPIDYQTIQAGNPIADLYFLIFTGTDRQFRTEYWDQLLDHYYRQLSAAMRRLGVDPERTYSREKYDKNAKELLPYGLIVAMTILPMVTVEEAPEVNKDNDISTFFEMEPGEVYIERLNGILADYIKWGIL